MPSSTAARPRVRRTLSAPLLGRRSFADLPSAGAIAGPIVDLDMRDMYLKDISLIGTTAWDEPVFPNLIRYIEAGEIRPLLAATWPLGEIAAAQEAFARKDFVGNFVLIPPKGVAG